MCTLTFIPKKNKDFVLTQNRDEAPNRIALPPDYYLVNGTKMLFPKDKLAGGTWIGISEKSRVVCVLNGGFECHQRKSNYRLSRGVVANDFMLSDDVLKTVDQYNFSDIEPFTMVVADWSTSLKLYELVWDGEQKHFSGLPLEPKIWSSSTLYSFAMKKERLAWFEAFKSENLLNSETLLGFHKSEGQGNTDYGVVMDRGFVKTTSITQIEKYQDNLKMRYEHLGSNSVLTNTFNIPQVVNE
ncbi:NRDE family protein [uncultured Algibacter sp.]|uniref:NRDE family protein n=1 Tax=uncultured Algibacter sp. TaxID=298659 RepID=UPI00261E2342|nr:NRDE family protein [uncultured Algibacter sp.]